MKKNTEVERCTVEVREKQDECKNKKKTESEKIAEKSDSSFEFYVCVGAEDRSFERNLNAASNNRKPRHLLPRDPFPIPTVSINVRVTTKRLTHESDDLNQLVFDFLNKLP